MLLDEDDYLEHYGTPRHSGRYPWGSGGEEDSSQRNKDFMAQVKELKRQGMTEAQIAEGFGMKSSNDLRAQYSIARNAIQQEKIDMVYRLKEKQYSNSAIAERMGLPNESSVRALIKQAESGRVDELITISDMLRDEVDGQHYVDIGTGVENTLGISVDRLRTAAAILENEGYVVTSVQTPQVFGSNKTTVKVIAPPGTKYSDVAANPDKIKTIEKFSDDGGETFFKIQPPMSLDSNRVAINYAETGGADLDGTMYVRPGVKDVSIGPNRYAQVRVAVDGTHYLKGMAMYKNDMPPGVDVIFNTNKSDTGNKLDAMKPLKKDINDPSKIDPMHPFGSQIRRQLLEKDSKGNDVLTSTMNLVNEEGAWEGWKRSLSSQTLSKQSPKLAKQQLEKAYQKKQADLDEIMALTNPVIKKKLLQSFADGADSSSVTLEAAAIPRSSWHAILPIKSMKDTEVYAPNFNNGERVALIRFPHAGTFEIPELTVNNNHPEAKALIGRAKDAIGINSKVAQHLSGADFDGDAVMVIPNNNRAIKITSPLAGLKDFDPKKDYPPYDGMKTIDGGTYNAKTREVDYGGAHPKGRTKQTQMGMVSNLITDMTIHGAKNDEMARAVRHSMVVIDSEKHHLNYKASYDRNGIADLQRKYQSVYTKTGKAGAATLISRSGKKSKANEPEVKLRSAKDGGPIDPATGKLVYVPTGSSYVNKQGKTVIVKTNLPKLALVDDARTLSSGMPIEEIYAEHSNKLKALANTARKEMLATKPLQVSDSAKKVYATEVASLNASLNVALKNKPRERAATLLAQSMIQSRKQSNPNMSNEDLTKIKAQAQEIARIRTGAKKQQIQISDREWEAIQAGAISNHRLTQIIDQSNLDQVKKLATPKQALLMDASKKNRAQAMLDSGATQAEVASALGVSLTTLKTALKEG